MRNRPILLLAVICAWVLAREAHGFAPVHGLRAQLKRTQNAATPKPSSASRRLHPIRGGLGRLKGGGIWGEKERGLPALKSSSNYNGMVPVCFYTVYV